MAAIGSLLERQNPKVNAMLTTTSFLLFVLAGAVPSTDEGAGPVAHYTFDEGSGDTLHDRSGHEHHGTIVGATWSRQDGRWSLRFDGQGDYVDFGDDPKLKLAGDSTILAWIRLDASPYPDDTTNWTIADCEEYRKEGSVIRVDGASAKVMYRSCQTGAEQYGFGTVALANHNSYLVGVVRRDGLAILHVDGVPDAQFAVQNPGAGAVPFKISSQGQSFNGLIYEVLVFDRALTTDEIAGYYWRGGAQYGKDVSQLGQLRITPFIYYDDKEARAEVDFFGVLPLVKDEGAVVELAHRGGEPVESKPVAAIPDRCKGEYAFAMQALAPGEYELRAKVKGPGRTVQASAPFSFPAPAVAVPSPEGFTVAPLPVEPPAPAIEVRTGEGGGVVLTIEGRSFPVESTFSFPNGGDNKLVCADAADKTGEPGWSVTGKRLDPATWTVDARGTHYAISRRIATQKGRVVVSDTIANLTREPLGIIFHNRLGIREMKPDKVYLAGRAVTRPVADRELKICPTIFVGGQGMGLGLVALDDVFIVQSRGSYEDQAVDLSSKEFALDAGASYTLEWAVYANAASDYYDFINAVRRDEGRNSVTVEGALSFIPGTQKRRDVSLMPAADYFEIRNAKYATLYCLSWCTDDPAVSVEGIEFVEFPQERERVRSMMDALAKTRPDVKGMFHVAQQLYATNRPNELFPDSRVIDAEGRHAVYPYDYGNGSYFSRERYEQNWRWWIYYPTLENSFGKALLDSVDVMMDQLGCRGAFVDGFLWGYGGEYTYDTWDGHSADIALDTKTIQRKKASTLLLTQDAMIAYCRKIWGKGGVVIANNVIPTRTICAQPLIIDKEVTEGPYVHLAPTPIALGNPGAIHSEVDAYRDVLNKLRWGNLFFYYGEPDTLTYESAPKQMYPITVEEVHEGCVKGKERTITMNSGVYGWPDSRDLHLAYRYDARGHRVRPGFVTTVDSSSVRTRVDLGTDEAAIVVRVPVTIETSTPVNVVVERYDEREVVMTLNGKGPVRVSMPGKGTFPVELDGQRQVRLPG